VSSPIKLMLFRDPESQELREGYVLWFEPPSGQVRGIILEEQAGREIADFAARLIEAPPDVLDSHENWLNGVLGGEKGEPGEVSGAVFRHLLALVQAYQRARSESRSFDD